MKIPHLDPQGNPIGEVEVPDPAKQPPGNASSRKPHVVAEVRDDSDSPQGDESHSSPSVPPSPRRETGGEVLGLDGEPIAHVRLHDQPGYASGGHFGMAIAVVVIVSIVGIAFFYMIFR